MSDRIPRGLRVVGLGFLALQAVLGPWRLSPSWDEAIYLSQVGPGPALPFAASRARGIVGLVAPFAAPDLPLPVIRGLLAVVAAAALVLAFMPWSRILGEAAVWAAALFASGWLVVLSGSAVMPNLWFALAGVGFVGAAILAARDGGRWVAMATALAIAAGLLRPFDALFLVVPVAAWLALRRPGLGLALLTGMATGVVPWVVEMSVRFGGLRRAVDEAAREGHVGTADLTGDLVDRVALLDGPITGPPDAISALPIAWVVVVLALAVAGAVTAGEGRAAARVLPLVATALALPYLVIVDVPAARFFLPAFGLVAVAAGVALERAWRRGPSGPIVAIVAAAWFATNLAVAWRVAADAQVDRAFPRAAGAAIREAAGTDGCVVVGYSWPQIAYEAGCEGRPAPVASASLDAARRSGLRVFIALRSGATASRIGESRPVFDHHRLVVVDAPSGS